LLGTRALLDLAEKSHLLLPILFFSFIGLLDVIRMASRCCFQFLTGMVDDYYKFRESYAHRQARFEKRMASNARIARKFRSISSRIASDEMDG
jgi:hypothetical protein